MSDMPKELKYTKTHEWVRQEQDGSITVGVTDHAQQLLGDMVFVDLPEVGAAVEADNDCAVVESVKAASDVYAPVSGEVTEVNESLADSPELVNKSPFGDGWLFRMEPSDPSALDALMDAEAYGRMVEAESH